MSSQLAEYLVMYSTDLDINDVPAANTCLNNVKHCNANTFPVNAATDHYADTLFHVLGTRFQRNSSISALCSG